MKFTTMFLFRLSVTLVLNLSLSSAFVSNKRSRTIVELHATNGDGDMITPEMGDVGFVLLAGGTGSRMKASMRKLLVSLLV
jgi:hypothetical protein